MQEVWKDVKGFEGLYKVSSSGRVFSVRAGRCLRLSLSDGYHRVKFCVDQYKVNFRVHRLVAEAFLEPPSSELVARCLEVEPDGRVVVRHADNDKLNNVPSNLSWGTSKNNSDDYKAFAGPIVACNRSVTQADAEYIRKVYVARDPEFGAIPLAKKFDKNKQWIRKIIANEIYK